jgi:DNA (cytosine-5)-methyltransferase 1
MIPSVGSLCAGYGGFELALKEVFGAIDLRWIAEKDPARDELAKRNFPAVPNLGDIKEIDWGSVPRVDIITAGIPCQPYSLAGKQKGGEDDRDLSQYFLEAIRVLQPKLALLENVPGFRSRGMPPILGALAEMGFDAVWHSVRASEAGAPHRRERVFLAAYPADHGQQWPWSAWSGGGRSPDSCC